MPVFQTDYGGTGLLQTPTARSAEEGDFFFNFSHVDPYINYAFSFQPFSWLQAGFRYTEVTNRIYGEGAPDLNYLDKGIDLKISLLDEQHYLPALAVGFRDLGGTGLFSSEYFVANKRWYNFDFSVGLAWGYLGNRENIDNPLKIFSDHFDSRPSGNDAGNGGEFNAKSWFTGDPALFGGVQYTTPWHPLSLQLEYEGNNYRDDPLNNEFDQDLPVNFGARLRLNDNITLSAAYERGNKLMLGATLGINLARLSQPKSNPARARLRDKPANKTNEESYNWNGVASQLSQNAGIATTRIARNEDTLIIEGLPTTYRSLAQSELRANRILYNVSDSDITSFKYRWKTSGFYLREDTLPKAPLPEKPLIVDPDSVFADNDYRLNITSSDVDKIGNREKSENTLYKSAIRGFTYNATPGLNYNVGGPDGILYQILAKLNLQYHASESSWANATLGYSLYDNLGKNLTIGPSKLPRVRTEVLRYFDNTDLGIYNLQFTHTARLSDNLFGMAYAGLLEQMFGGVGGEVLYRPFNSRVAFGADINWVKKRDFDTQFGFQDYSTVEGHATAYINTGIDHILAKLSVGRYLAKDYGTTIDLSKTFESGIRLGAYAMFTSAGDDYGEGSFNKGIYLTMPLDIFFTKSSRSQVTARYSPLTRDGGAPLNRRYSLYSLTGTRTLNRYWDGFETDHD